jgi:mannosyltransferase OCH1-like enzyme
MIPKIIWQTYENKYENLSYNYKMASLTWKNLNPGWEYRYCSSEERELHIKEYSQDLYPYYKKLIPVTQADVWRLCILYLKGGFYTDMDSLCQIPLDHVFDNYIKKQNFVVMPKQPDGSCIIGSMSSIKDSKITKEILDELIVNIQNVSKYKDSEIYIHFNIISDIIKKHYDDIDFNLLSPLHGGHEGNKYAYTSDFIVKIDDQDIKYCDLAKNNNWLF